MEYIHWEFGFFEAIFPISQNFTIATRHSPVYLNYFPSFEVIYPKNVPWEDNILINVSEHDFLLTWILLQNFCLVIPYHPNSIFGLSQCAKILNIKCTHVYPAIDV